MRTVNNLYNGRDDTLSTTTNRNSHNSRTSVVSNIQYTVKNILLLSNYLIDYANIINKAQQS